MTDLKRAYLLGAAWNDKDQTQRFLESGVWESARDDAACLELVKGVSVGDRVAIKASYVKRNDLPFNTNGNSVSCMSIKARGVVTANPGDGKRLLVDWEEGFKPKVWLFFTSRNTIWKVDAETGDWKHRALLDFVFSDTEQDYEKFIEDPFWSGRYGAAGSVGQEEGPDVEAPVPYSHEDFFEEVFMEEADYEKIVGLLRRKKNVILQGSPGTGKTFAAERIAYSLIGSKDKSRICSVQFHQNSTYEDYIIGYRPDEETGSFTLQEGLFVEFFDLAARHREQDYYLIIDEINRANISKVFGEMLMAIECDHRDEEIEFPTTKRRKFSVPSNVYIIGMMNTADRGLALIDYALRRRFAFVSMEPAFGNKTFRKMISDLECPELDLLIDKVEVINHQIESDPSLGPGFKIGHSYFCIDFPASRESVESVIEYELVPLVREYWFEQLDVAEEAINELESALE